MLEPEIASLIASAIITEDILDMTPEELGELSVLEYENDPDVEFFDLEFTPDAGADLHGVNTEEEMMKTLGDE
jgi:hypothetical protein